MRAARNRSPLSECTTPSETELFADAVDSRLPLLEVLQKANGSQCRPGHPVQTIEVDPEHAPLVTWTFEQHATGRYPIAQLTTLLEEQGFAMRTSPSRPE
ncbi:MAG: hypothetical protein B5766_00020 [Candidatus Lumbricidophila eiseniae]|uniref:Uncharacterized protein n=1 Tax=Candidatus Lumbricidiphila eiseniae TaxID=1969409 RepID=A0A2A6FV79_9MICO|nr:MAG: hypothetical protein B5766_00020 [Candidatus Lumbricidophila eiseniae]